MNSEILHTIAQGFHYGSIEIPNTFQTEFDAWLFQVEIQGGFELNQIIKIMLSGHSELLIDIIAYLIDFTIDGSILKPKYQHLTFVPKFLGQQNDEQNEVKNNLKLTPQWNTHPELGKFPKITPENTPDNPSLLSAYQTKQVLDFFGINQGKIPTNMTYFAPLVASHTMLRDTLDLPAPYPLNHDIIHIIWVLRSRTDWTGKLFKQYFEKEFDPFLQGKKFDQIVKKRGENVLAQNNPLTSWSLQPILFLVLFFQLKDDCGYNEDDRLRMIFEYSYGRCYEENNDDYNRIVNGHNDNNVEKHNSTQHNAQKPSKRYPSLIYPLPSKAKYLKKPQDIYTALWDHPLARNFCLKKSLNHLLEWIGLHSSDLYFSMSQTSTPISKLYQNHSYHNYTRQFCQIVAQSEYHPPVYIILVANLFTSRRLLQSIPKKIIQIDQIMSLHNVCLNEGNYYQCESFWPKYYESFDFLSKSSNPPNELHHMGHFRCSPTDYLSFDIICTNSIQSISLSPDDMGGVAMSTSKGLINDYKVEMETIRRHLGEIEDGNEDGNGLEIGNDDDNDNDGKNKISPKNDKDKQSQKRTQLETSIIFLQDYVRHLEHLYLLTKLHYFYLLHLIGPLTIIGEPIRATLFREKLLKNEFLIEVFRHLGFTSIDSNIKNIMTDATALRTIDLIERYYILDKNNEKYLNTNGYSLWPKENTKNSETNQLRFNRRQNPKFDPPINNDNPKKLDSDVLGWDINGVFDVITPPPLIEVLKSENFTNVDIFSKKQFSNQIFTDVEIELLMPKTPHYHFP